MFVLSPNLKRFRLDWDLFAGSPNKADSLLGEFQLIVNPTNQFALFSLFLSFLVGAEWCFDRFLFRGDIDRQVVYSAVFLSLSRSAVSFPACGSEEHFLSSERR